MTAPATPLRIHPGQVETDDLRYRLTPGPVTPGQRLKASIRRFGLLHPPLLRQSAGRLLIVAGHARLLAARETMAATRIPCLQLSDQWPEEDYLAAALEETLACRPATVMEQAIFLDKLSHHLDAGLAAERYLPRFGRAGGRHQLEQLVALTRLPEPLAIAVHQGRLAEKTARLLLPLPFADQMALFEVCEFLALSHANQGKLVAACVELARRQEGSVLSLLRDPGIREILNHPRANPPQKTANLMRLLTEKRFPRLTQAEKTFHRLAASLELPPRARLGHTRSFEDDRLTLTLSFEDQAELERYWPGLRRILLNPDP